MAIIDGFRAELEHEGKLTRKFLERLPEDAREWAPHPKSMKLGRLAGHIAEMHGWAADVLLKDELNFDMANYKPWTFADRAELLTKFDEMQAASLAAMKDIDDAAMMQVWTLKIDGKVFFAMPRVAALRGMTMNHIVHHRAQLGVYYRICGVPVPSTYGPSADEQ